MDDLVETLEGIVEAAEWALAADWTNENLQERVAGILAQARYGLDQALDAAVAHE